MREREGRMFGRMRDMNCCEKELRRNRIIDAAVFLALLAWVKFVLVKNSLLTLVTVVLKTG